MAENDEAENDEVVIESLTAYHMLDQLKIPSRSPDCVRLSLWGRIVQAIMRENNGTGKMSESILNLVRETGNNANHFSRR